MTPCGENTLIHDREARNQTAMALLCVYVCACCNLYHRAGYNDKWVQRANSIMAAIVPSSQSASQVQYSGKLVHYKQ